MGNGRAAKRRSVEAPIGDVDRQAAPVASPAPARAAQSAGAVRDIVGNRAMGAMVTDRAGPARSIVAVTAFERDLKNAQATYSDGTTGPLPLTENGLPHGSYRMERDESREYHYRITSDVEPGSGGFRWAKPQGTDWAERVEIEILTGSPQTLREQIAALDPAIQQALTTDEGVGAGPPSYADMNRVLTAGEILEMNGVTGDELALLEYRRAEARDFGHEPAEAVDPVDWAATYVADRQIAGQKALDNRTKLVAAREQIDALPPQVATVIREFCARNEDLSWDSIEQIFERMEHIHLADAIAAFEFELRSVTETFLSQSLLALFKIEKTYLADRNVGAEREALRIAIQKIRPSVFQREAGQYELLRQQTEHLFGASNADQVKAWTEEVAKRDEDLQTESQAANLPVANWKGFDADLILNADVDAARDGLRAFVFDARGRLQRAERMSKDVKNLYRADHMVAMAKSAAGITPGSLLGDVITFRGQRETADDGFWSTLWDVISLALMFVPGNVGLILRVGAGIVNASKQADDIAGAHNRYMTGMSSADPSSLGLYLSVGGTIIDAAQMAHGVFAVAGEEASAASVARRAGGETPPPAPPHPEPAAPPPAPAPEEVVWVNTGQGRTRGRYHAETSPHFGQTEGVAMPKSQADAYGLVPAGTPHSLPKPAITPRVVNGRVAESLGADAGKGRGFISATAQKEVSVNITSIRPDLNESQAYNTLLDRGELGLQRPLGSNAPGVDAITVKVDFDPVSRQPVGAMIYVNDFTTPGQVASKSTVLNSAWRNEVTEAVSAGRLNFGDPELERVIREAAQTNNVEVRIVTVDRAGKVSQ